MIDWEQWEGGIPQGIHPVAVDALMETWLRARDQWHREPQPAYSYGDELMAVLGLLEHLMTEVEDTAGMSQAQCIRHRYKLLPVVRLMLRLSPETPGERLPDAEG
jgi:hypothetical protein